MKKFFSVVGVVCLISCNHLSHAGEKGEKPFINDPSVVGVYPDTPFLFAIPTSGTRPIIWSSSELPDGLRLNAEKGFIEGVAPKEGNYDIILYAENRFGKASGKLKIKSGTSLALTPPMGWNSWNTFADNISDSLIRQVADSMVSTGMRDLGYTYINIDDLWQLAERDSKGRIQVDKEKFPDGIKPVADYLHSRGLKLGIYSDAANKTCGGVAGSYGFEKQDALLFADWGIDLLKYDYCKAPKEKDTAIVRYSRMGSALQKSGRSIVFSVCEWGQREPWTWARSVGGQYWRTTWDIRNSWKRETYSNIVNSIMQILDINVVLNKFAGPGHWNDPDMLVVGIYDNPNAWAVNSNGATGCSDLEYRSHMSLWCLMAAPLLCGNDIRNMNKETKNILMNPEIIAIDQDPLGIQAKKIKDTGDQEVFVKELSDGSFAVGLLNRNDINPVEMRIMWDELGIKGKWFVRDIWQHENLGTFSYQFETHVEPHECKVIKLFK